VQTAEWDAGAAGFVARGATSPSTPRAQLHLRHRERNFTFKYHFTGSVFADAGGLVNLVTGGWRRRRGARR